MEDGEAKRNVDILYVETFSQSVSSIFQSAECEGRKKSSEKHNNQQLIAFYSFE